MTCKSKRREVVELTKAITKIAPNSHAHNETDPQTAPFGCTTIKFTKAQNQPGDTSFCRKSMGAWHIFLSMALTVSLVLCSQSTTAQQLAQQRRRNSKDKYANSKVILQ